MSKTKEIEGKIKSLQNITKITKAMQLIAASRFNKAHQSIGSAREYEKGLLAIEQEFINNPRMLELKHLHSYCETQSEAGKKISTAVAGKKNQRLINAHVYLLTSEKGLCGSYNVALIREHHKQVELLKKANRRVTVHFFGRKGKEGFSESATDNRDASVIGEHQADIMLRLISYGEVRELVKKIKAQFLSGSADEVYFFYSNFKSVIHSELTLEKILPLQFSNEKSDGVGSISNADVAIDKEAGFVPLWDRELEEQNSFRRRGGMKDSMQKSNSNVILEPNLPVVVDGLLKQFLNFKCYLIFLNSMTSEHASRMQAMDNATKNGNELIDKNKLLRNKIRQAAITTELTEIVAGMEGLK